MLGVSPYFIFINEMFVSYKKEKEKKGGDPVTPMEEGELGIISIQHKNKPLLAWWIWRVNNEIDAL